MHIVGSILIVIVLLFVLGGVYLFLSTRIVGLNEVTFWRAVGVNCITALLYPLIIFITRLVFHGGMFSLLIVFVLQIWILSALLKTTWVRALGVTVVYNLFLIVSVLAIVALKGFNVSRFVM
jgi:hypothetical protein